MLFGCVLFGYAVFLFAEVSCSFRLDCSCLSILSVSDIVLLSCSLFVFLYICNISRSENQLFFIIVLFWLVWKLVHSCQTSIIIFLYPLYVELLLKSYYCVGLSALRGSLDRYSCNWKKNNQHLQDDGWVSHIGYRRPPIDHNTHAYCLGPTLCHILIQRFYHEWYIVVIPDPGAI